VGRCDGSRPVPISGIIPTRDDGVHFSCRPIWIGRIVDERKRYKFGQMIDVGQVRVISKRMHGIYVIDQLGILFAASKEFHASGKSRRAQKGRFQ
jgi:hypothetical protein